MAARNKDARTTFRIIYVFCLVAVATLFSLASTSVYPILKNQVQSHGLSLKDIEAINLTLIGSLDGGMYEVLKESLKSNLFDEEISESKKNLADLGIDIDSQEGRNLLYLSHTDRGRLLYPGLILTLETLFGNYSYLILNVFAYTLLVMFFIYILGITKNTHLVLLLLAGSTVPLFIFSFMPELSVYLLTTIYLYYLLSQYVDFDFQAPPEILRKPTVAIIVLIALLLMKPVFVVLLAAQIAAIFFSHKKMRIQLFLHIGISLLFSLAWVISKAANRPPLEIGLAKDPIKAVISPTIDFDYGNSSIPNFPITSIVPTLSAELNAQFTKFQNIPIIILLLALIFAFKYASLKLNVFLGSILFGTLLTQSYGGGLGTNYRTLNIFLIFALLIIGSILKRDDSKPRVSLGL